MTKYNFYVTFQHLTDRQKYEQWMTSVEDNSDIDLFAWREVVERAENHAKDGMYVRSIRLLGVESY